MTPLSALAPRAAGDVEVEPYAEFTEDKAYGGPCPTGGCRQTWMCPLTIE